MNLTIRKNLCLAASLALALVGCDNASSPGAAAATPGTSDSAPQMQTVADDLGRSVTLPAEPRRIAAGAPFAVEMLYLLGRPPIVRPTVEDEHVRPKAAHELPTMAVDHGVGPNMEQLATARPEVLVLSPTFAQFAPDIERNLEIPTLVYAIRSVGDVGRVLREIGQWTGRTATADAAASRIEAQLESHRRPVEDGPRVFAIFGAGDAFFAFLPDSYLGSMVELLGGRMITEGDAPMRPGSSLSPFSLEAAVAADPDVILVVRHGPETEAARQMQQQPAWRDLRAVREGRVHQIDEWLYLSSPGPSAPEAVGGLKPLLDPTQEKP